MAEILAVRPVLPSRLVVDAVGFYVDRLGFRLAFQDSDLDPRYAGVRRDGVEIHLQWHDPAEWSAVERPMLRLLVDDVDALCAEFVSRGVLKAGAVARDTAWGTREFAFFDPDQNGLTFYRDV